MTEEEWLTATAPGPLLQHVRGRVSYRKLRLFAVACCRRLQAIEIGPRYRRMIESTERFADGVITGRQFLSAFPGDHLAMQLDNNPAGVTRRAILALNWPDRELPRHEFDERSGQIVPAAWAPGEYAEHYTSRICLHLAHAEALIAMGTDHEPGADVERFRGAMAAGAVAQVEVFRDVFCNPFRPVAFDQSWRTSTTVGIALSMYESRGFGAMPILADALEEAGCDSADVLAHCRGSGPHVRGCWVVDLVLGKV